MEFMGNGRNRMLHKQGCKTGAEKEATDKKRKHQGPRSALKEETEPFAEHLFNKDWQNHHEKVLKKKANVNN